MAAVASLTQYLRPRPGHRLPRRLRHRKIGRYARSLPLGLRDPDFEVLLSQIDGGGHLRGGNQIELYFDGDRATAAMLQAIDEAKEEVLLEAYIFTADDTGQRFADTVAKAAARGVTVRVLVDAVGSWGTKASFWETLVEAGCEVRIFHRLFPQFWNQLLRDHRKILVIDRCVAFTGGMNIADEYASFSRRRRRPRDNQMRDTHLRLVGPCAWELAAVFAEGWERSGGEVLPITPEPESSGAAARALVLDSRPGRGHRETAAVFSAIISAARDSVYLTNAYFAPSPSTVAVLAHAASRGLDVRLLLPGKTDVALVRHAGHGWYSRLLSRGVRIFEYQPVQLHAKTLVADRFAAVVGSTNLDFRSFRFNAECNVVMLDDDIGDSLARAFEGDLESAEEIKLETWRQRGFGHRLLDRLAGSLTRFL